MFGQENEEVQPDTPHTDVPSEQAENFYDYTPIFEEAWELANEYFVEQPLDGDVLIQARAEDE